MTEEESSKFTTKRRSIGSGGELKWGGEDGEEWSDAVESSENITVTDDGTITTGSKVPDSELYQNGDGEENWYSFTIGSANVSKELDHLYIEASGDNVEGHWEYRGPVDLSDFSEVRVYWENTGDSSSSRVGITADTTQETDHSESEKVYERDTDGDWGPLEDFLDISDLEGEYYITVYARDGAAIATQQSELLTYEVELIK